MTLDDHILPDLYCHMETYFERPFNTLTHNIRTEKTT